MHITVTTQTVHNFLHQETPAQSDLLSASAAATEAPEPTGGQAEQLGVTNLSAPPGAPQTDPGFSGGSWVTVRQQVYGASLSSPLLSSLRESSLRSLKLFQTLDFCDILTILQSLEKDQRSKITLNFEACCFVAMVINHQVFGVFLAWIYTGSYRLRCGRSQASGIILNFAVMIPKSHSVTTGRELWGG